MNSQQADFYQMLRAEIRTWLKSEVGSMSQWGEYLMFAPDLFHLLCKLSLDPDVPIVEKVKLTAAIAYFISPIDLIPGFGFGPLGYVDDIALAAYVLNSIIKSAGPAIVRRHWAGEGDVLEVTTTILEFANRTLGGGFLKRIEQIFR